MIGKFEDKIICQECHKEIKKEKGSIIRSCPYCGAGLYDIRLKDRLTCPGCNKEIINNKGIIIDKCPHCGMQLFDVQWIEKDLVNELYDVQKANKLNEKGLSVYMEGNLEEAIKWYDEGLLINPKSASLYNNKGVALTGLKQYEESIRCFDKAIEINPSEGDPWRNKGGALIQIDQKARAIEHFDKAIDINPNDAQAWFGKGMALLDTEKSNEGIKCLKKADTLGFEPAKQAMLLFNLHVENNEIKEHETQNNLEEPPINPVEINKPKKSRWKFWK